MLPLLLSLVVSCGDKKGQQTDYTSEDRSGGRFSKPSVTDLMREQPTIAIWYSSSGNRKGGKATASSLRAAIWPDGRILFLENPQQRSSMLRYGRVTTDEIEKLKHDLEETGIFELKGYCYLVPDAPVLCILVNSGTHQQILYWDEVENPNYGINAQLKPHHVTFKKAWHAANALALSLRPPDSVPLEEQLAEPPDSWYVKRAIQSE